MPEADDAKNQFLDAISVMSPHFHETWVLRLQDKGDIEFTELLNRYKAHWKITYGKQASQKGISKAVFATWQGHEEVKPTETKQEKCWDIFEEIRPPNYKPVAPARQKWEKAMKANPTWKALVEKKRTELNQSKKPTEQANVTLGGEAFGFFTTPAMPTNDNEIPTEKRWVVDTGAQVHVCNDRRLFVTFEDAQSVVKGFRYPKLSPENLILATKRSAQEPRSEGSIQTWHRRLGHVGTERIEKLAEMTEGITIESNPGKKKQRCLTTSLTTTTITAIITNSFNLSNFVKPNPSISARSDLCSTINRIWGVETVDEEEEIERQLQREMIYSPTPELSSQRRAPRDISASIETSNIVTGTRSRKPRIDPDYATYLSLAQEEPPSLLYAFTTSMNQRFKTKPHREDLPPPPENWIQMKNHRFAKEFMAAASFEVQTLKKKRHTQKFRHRTGKNTQVLPLKWVFTYKFDANGVLEKFKARICVRAVFALVAAFDLDMRQRDVVTAFLNSSLQSETYTKCPQDSNGGTAGCSQVFGCPQGYGNRKQHEDPCIFTTNGIIVFFYVDDIIIVNHPNFAKQATKLDQDLKKEWEMRELDATWFLNICILRDRDQKKLWLCQDSYIESMTNKYNLVTTRKIHGYQAKVGSAQYATTISRPDAAKATSKVAEFLTNPGPKHMDAIDRIIQYLYETRYWAIEYGTRPRDAYPTQSENNPGLSLAAKSIEFASDASFGDNRDRKSSEGYLCKLYGGPIDWKASKQKTVTTSTTEAELLALAEAGKTIQWWRRVLHSLGFEPDHPLSIMCDNQQTVDLLTKEGAAMHTKLRHVDINRCWMKQEVCEGRVNVDWVPTAAMPADGLTKVLPKQKQQVFRELLGMREIRDRIIPESDGRSSS
ncbi:hypothetical protein PDIDSM_7624 [Penicillium digitatum]|nr:hypothetical protein PDIDSM_7624 [Penicillium digitatum]